MKDFKHRTADIIAWVADTLMPQGAQLENGGVDIVIDLLNRRAGRFDC